MKSPSPTRPTADETPEATKKRTRSPAQPSDETLAMRAIREMRMLDEKEVAARDVQSEKLQAIGDARVALDASLSPSVRELIAAIQKARNGAQ